ncbi:MAG: hypothetical protein ABSC94_05765 [Polyangiaceae bacterium]
MPNEFDPLGARARPWALRPSLKAVLIAACGTLGCACEAPAAKAPSAAELCANVPETEKARPSFLGAGEIEAVRPAMGERRLIKTTVTELRGAELVVRAEPGMTKQWIARLVRCHMAWQEAVGAEGDDPFVTGRPSVSFDEEETNFIIRILGRDRHEGEDILARAQRFVAPARAPVDAKR